MTDTTRDAMIKKFETGTAPSASDFKSLIDFATNADEINAGTVAVDRLPKAEATRAADTSAGTAEVPGTAGIMTFADASTDDDDGTTAVTPLYLSNKLSEAVTSAITDDNDSMFNELEDAIERRDYSSTKLITLGVVARMFQEI